MLPLWFGKERSAPLHCALDTPHSDAVTFGHFVSVRMDQTRHAHFVPSVNQGFAERDHVAFLASDHWWIKLGKHEEYAWLLTSTRINILPIVAIGEQLPKKTNNRRALFDRGGSRCYSVR
jgi:hypothetical protein